MNQAILWLKENASNNYCSKYSLVHGDYHPGNVCLTKDSELVVLDWDSIEIGDPAFDVGYAYHFIKFFNNPKHPELGERAEQFICKYASVFNGNISRTIDYYKIVGVIGTTIFRSSSLSSPIYACKYYRHNILPTTPTLGKILVLLAFPFLHSRTLAPWIGTKGDIYWLEYFKTFLDNNLK